MVELNSNTEVKLPKFEETPEVDLDIAVRFYVCDGCIVIGLDKVDETHVKLMAVTSSKSSTEAIAKYVLRDPFFSEALDGLGINIESVTLEMQNLSVLAYSDVQEMVHDENSRKQKYTAEGKLKLPTLASLLRKTEKE